MKNLNQLLSNWKGPKILMTVFPHPDDETMDTGGLLTVAKKLGWKTIVMTLTHGEAGQNYTPQANKTLKEIRTSELSKAAKILKTDRVIIGDFPDRKIRETKAKWSDWIKKQIQENKPSLIVSYDHSGLTGHPDHIAVSVELKKILIDSKNNAKLFWLTLPVNLRKHVVPKELINYLPKPEFILNLGWNWINKWRAVKAHKSQKLGNDFPIPLIIDLAIFHYEWYYEVDLNKEYPYKYIKFDI